jgi:hypothetical protein
MFFNNSNTLLLQVCLCEFTKVGKIVSFHLDVKYQADIFEIIYFHLHVKMRQRGEVCD